MIEIAMTLKARITEDMKTAMKAKDTARLGAIRLLLAAIKQKEVDERADMDDAAIIAVIDKQMKQRRDSVSQYEAAGRQDLADKEKAEMDVFAAYLPQPLTDAEIDALIHDAIAATAAAGMGDMGKVMGVLRPQLAGRADMGAVSARIKSALAGR
ncbi:GatB/YqeY domain-containing protein [Microvirgula curvata]